MRDMVAHAPLLYLLRRPLSLCLLCPVMGRIVEWHVSHIAVLNSSLRPESWHTMWVATLAQLVEHPPCKRTVVGSSPTGGSIFYPGDRLPVFPLCFQAFEMFLNLINSGCRSNECSARSVNSQLSIQPTQRCAPSGAFSLQHCCQLP